MTSTRRALKEILQSARLYNLVGCAYLHNLMFCYEFKGITFVIPNLFRDLTGVKFIQQACKMLKQVQHEILRFPPPPFVYLLLSCTFTPFPNEVSA